MTNRPSITDEFDWAPGLVALALFVVLAIVVLQSTFGAPKGFPSGANITATIGYALFDLQGRLGKVSVESFLAPFEIIDLVLVAALAGAVMLAKRDTDNGGDSLSLTLVTDGGRVVRGLFGDESDRDDQEGGR